MHKIYITSILLFFISSGLLAQCIADAGNDTSICRSDLLVNEAIIIGGSPAATGGVPPYQYNWSAGPISIQLGIHKAEWLFADSTAANPSVFEIYEKSFDFILTVTDSTGATCSDTIVVEFCGAPPNLFPHENNILAVLEQGDSLIIGTDHFPTEPPSPPHDIYCGNINFVSWHFNAGSIQDPNSYNTVIYPDSSGYLWSEIVDDAGCVHKNHEYSVRVYPVGIEEKTAEKNVLTVFPNPVGSAGLHLSAEVNLNGKLQVFNSVGSLVSEQQLRILQGETVQINTSNWSRGVYLLRVENVDATETHRVVK